MRLLPHILAIVVFYACAFDMTPHGARVLRSASSSVRRSIGTALRHDHVPRRQRRCCCLPQRIRQHSSWALATASSSSSSSSSETTSDEVLALEARIESLVGRKINVNSPKQVSLAVFGRVQSASRSVLEEAAAALASSSLSPHEVSGNGLSPTQREIASLVLRHRDLTRACGGPSNGNPTGVGSTQRLSSASTMVSNIEEEESVCDSDGDDSNEVGELERQGSADAPRSWSDHGALSAQHHERAVRALFGRTGNQINRYWEEPLLELNRPSAKALVPQLDSTGCPMGFDPLARPFVVGSAIMSPELQGSDALGPSAGPQSTTTAGKKGSFLAYCRDQKNKYPDAIILTRCK
jgi:hypothetical protein